LSDPQAFNASIFDKTLNICDSLAHQKKNEATENNAATADNTIVT
jgi:hypothetical protein